MAVVFVGLFFTFQATSSGIFRSKYDYRNGTELPLSAPAILRKQSTRAAFPAENMKIEKNNYYYYYRRIDDFIYLSAHFSER